MITEGYSIHLVCDGELCGKTEAFHSKAIYVAQVNEFGGKNKKTAWDNVKSQGWIRKGSKVFCCQYCYDLSQQSKQV